MKFQINFITILIVSITISCNPNQFDLDGPPMTFYEVRLDNISSVDTLYIEWQRRVPIEVKKYSTDLNFNNDSLELKSEILLKWMSVDSIGATEIFKPTWKTLYLGRFDVEDLYQPNMTEDQLISLVPDIKLFVKMKGEKTLVLDNTFFHNEENWHRREYDPKGTDGKVPETCLNRFSMLITDEMLK